MGNRAQVRLTLEGQSINVISHWAGAYLGQVLQQALFYVLTSPGHQPGAIGACGAAYILGQLLDDTPLAKGELPSRRLEMGQVKYCADHRGLEVDCDTSKVRLYASDFADVLTEWTLREFTSLSLETRDGELWFEGFDVPEPDDDLELLCHSTR